MGVGVVTQATAGFFLFLSNSARTTMAKRTKKVGVVGKYGTRYGASLRKTVKKDGNHSTLQVPLHILRKGEHETHSCWYLVLRCLKLSHHGRQRCLDLLNYCCSLSSIRHQKIERNEGHVKIVLYLKCAVDISK